MVALALVLGGLLVLAARSDTKRWTDEEFERRSRAGTAGGNAFLTLQAMFDPGAQHALEQRMVEEADQAESGDPPDPTQRDAS